MNFFAIFCLLAIGAATAQDVLLFRSSVKVNGTQKLNETDPLCVTQPFQFNGSSSLFSPDRRVWIKDWTGVYKRTADYYASYLVNPTTVPSYDFWWVYPCNSWDVKGWASSMSYIPEDASSTLSITCSAELYMVFACEGVVPDSDSPTISPTNSPTQPTRLPSMNPTCQPTQVPTRLQTSDAAECDCLSHAMFGAIFGGVVLLLVIG